MHYNSTDQVVSTDLAAHWWNSLNQYLNNQEYASKKGVWPLNKGLSHGSAAAIQLEMERLAEPLGWKDDLLSSIFRNEGWLSGKLTRLNQNGKLINSHSPCPRGCIEFHYPFRKPRCETWSCSADCKKTHKKIVRADCPNRKIVEQLVKLEHERRTLENEIIEIVRKNGVACCGTMKNCQLKN